MLKIKKAKMIPFFFGIIFFIFSLTVNGFAQSNTEDEAESSWNDEAIVKMSGISPGAGVSLRLGNSSKLRLLGFFSTNFYKTGLNNYYYLDISYVRYNNWIKSTAVDSYWGIDLSFEFQDPTTAPGLLIGSTYHLNEQFAIFGEIGLNVFIYDDGNDSTLGLLNSGVGIKLAL